MQRATKEEIEAYLVKMGRHGMQTLSILGKLQPFAQAMESEIGQVVLGYLVNRHEELLNSVIEGQPTEEMRLELRVIKHLLIDLASKVNEYNNRIDTIKKKATE